MSARVFLGTVAFVLASAATASAQDFTRWVDLQTFTVGARYRFVTDSDRVKTTHDVQDNSSFKARVKADRNGRLAVHVGVFTGGSITGAWNNTGVGAATMDQPISVKQLYVAARPASWIEAQVGSLYAVRGESTEISHFDNDVYLMGQRAIVRAPRRVFLDEIAVTHGYLGDATLPSVFDRADRMGESNFRQVLAAKKIGPRVLVSADWMDAADRTTWHAGAGIRVGRLVDAVRAEYYVRPDEDAQGGALSIERRLVRGIVVSGGYANIDRNVGSLTGDRYNRGGRLFGVVVVPVTRVLAANVYYTHGLANDYRVANNQRFDVVISYNVLATIQKAAAR